MKSEPMNLNEVDTEDLVAMLRHVSVETGSLTCLGCGHEHNCGTRGCALIRAAADRLDASRAPTLTPPNEPLTFDELREMDGPVWVACKPIEGGNGYWCLCQRGHIITPAGSIFDVKEIPHWVFYRRPPEGEANGQ